VEAPDKMLKLHKYGYLTADMLLSRNICFSTVEHLAHTKIEDIFRAFKIVFKLCMQRSFKVTHEESLLQPTVDARKAGRTLGNPG